VIKFLTYLIVVYFFNTSVFRNL